MTHPELRAYQSGWDTLESELNRHMGLAFHDSVGRRFWGRPCEDIEDIIMCSLTVRMIHPMHSGTKGSLLCSGVE
jgi:hypothetical protein